MEMIINDSRTIRELQQEFNNTFPFLKLEFFDVPHAEKKALPKSRMIPNDRKIGTIRKNHREGKLIITENETVSQLENDLWNNFGLSAQVFRKSGNLWIETSLTDSWTLERQNREGYEMSNGYESPYRKGEDLDPGDRDKWE